MSHPAGRPLRDLHRVGALLGKTLPELDPMTDQEFTSWIAYLETTSGIG